MSACPGRRRPAMLHEEVRAACSVEQRPLKLQGRALKALGVIPQVRRKAMANWLGLPKPLSSAISARLSAGSAIRLFAWAILRLSRNRWGGTPVDCLKAVQKCVELKPTCIANSASDGACQIAFHELDRPPQLPRCQATLGGWGRQFGRATQQSDQQLQRKRLLIK